jgi:hypothetical protein
MFAGRGFCGKGITFSGGRERNPGLGNPLAGRMLTALLALLHAAPALAAGPRLLLVGDTGDDTAMARVVAADLAAAQAGAEAIIALGDLYYDAPPIDAPDCVDQLVARYSAFFRTLDPAKVVPVTGNHDVTTVEQKSFSPAARACTVAAWKKLGWVKDDAPSHVRALQKGGVRVDLAVIDSGFYGEGAPRPSLSFRKQAHWRFYAAHYVWRSGVGKCGERDKVPVEWLGRPPMHAWLNGHAHQVEGTLALTSGAGMEMRSAKDCGGVESLFTYTKPEAADAGGWLQLDVLSATELRVTPRVCSPTGCEWKPALSCTKGKDPFSVACTPTADARPATPMPPPAPAPEPAPATPPTL